MEKGELGTKYLVVGKVSSTGVDYKRQVVHIPLSSPVFQ